MNYRIKDICKSKGVSVGSLADTVGMQRESLSRIINGANTSTDTLERIATALNVSVSELIDEPKAGNFVCPNCGAELRLSAEVEGKA
jgi:transcriptional regulator with XRE-family HTH domain